jgi:hypothetical protein
MRRFKNRIEEKMAMEREERRRWGREAALASIA